MEFHAIFLLVSLLNNLKFIFFCILIKHLATQIRNTMTLQYSPSYYDLPQGFNISPYIIMVLGLKFIIFKIIFINLL